MEGGRRGLALGIFIFTVFFLITKALSLIYLPSYCTGVDQHVTFPFPTLRHTLLWGRVCSTWGLSENLLNRYPTHVKIGGRRSIGSPLVIFCVMATLVVQGFFDAPSLVFLCRKVDLCARAL